MESVSFLAVEAEIPFWGESYLHVSLGIGTAVLPPREIVPFDWFMPGDHVVPVAAKDQVQLHLALSFEPDYTPTFEYSSKHLVVGSQAPVVELDIALHLWITRVDFVPEWVTPALVAVVHQRYASNSDSDANRQDLSLNRALSYGVAPFSYFETGGSECR